jgi:hypothetical protein
MNDNDTELARLQADFLDCLARDESSEALTRLRKIETSLPYRSWMESFDPHMTELASRLVQKWGRRGEP